MTLSWPSTRYSGSANTLRSVPANEGPATARAGGRAVHGHVVDHSIFSFVSCIAPPTATQFSDSDVAEYSRSRGSDLSVSASLSSSALSSFAIQLLVDHEVAQAARGDDGHARRLGPTP